MESNRPIKIISAESISVKQYFQELIQYRHLIWFFALQEFKTQYVKTRLNFLWVVIKPLMVLALFTFIFGRLITIPGLKYPYPLFAFTGLLVWNNFSFLVNNGGNVVVNNQNLIKKIYFPRVILLLSKLLISLIELSVSFLLTIVLMLFLRYPFSAKIIFVPIFISISIMCGLTIAIWLNALNIRHRDLHQFVPTLIGFLIWLTPVFYPVTIIPHEFSIILYLNPISASIQGCRWAILGDTLPSLYYLPMILFSFFVFIVGLIVFIRSEGDLVDYV